MNEEMKETPFFTQFLRSTGTIFTSTVLTISVAGMIFARFDPSLRETSSLFALTPIGITYNTILQIFLGSVILAAAVAFLFSERYLYKMKFLLRTVIFLLMVLILFSLFSIIFKWFSVNEPIAWFRFFVSIFICFSVSTGLTLVKQRLEGKKYNKLLESYKARHNIG